MEGSSTIFVQLLARNHLQFRTHFFLATADFEASNVDLRDQIQDLQVFVEVLEADK